MRIFDYPIENPLVSDVYAKLMHENMEQIRVIVREEVQKALRPHPTPSGILLIGDTPLRFCPSCEKPIHDGRPFRWQAIDSEGERSEPLVPPAEWFCACEKPGDRALNLIISAREVKS